MKARGPLLLLVLALIALPAGTAHAKPGYVVKPRSLHLNLALPASDGYSASIQTEGHRKVSLKVSRGSFFATYSALGRVSRKGIEADFGDFGQVSLRFKPRSRFAPQRFSGVPLPDSLREKCKGKRSVGERGLFLGNVRFEGERDYTHVTANRLKGKVVRRYRQVCKRRSGAAFASKAKPREESVFYSAQAQQLGVLRFLFGIEGSIAFRDEEVAFTIAFGGERKKVGPVGVLKLLLVLEDLDSIEISPLGARPVTAEIKMRRPFEGTASYLQEGKAPATWTGTLGLRLPGSGLVPLAGPEFEAEICRGSREAGFDRCAESILFDSPLAQGSGSHSQPLALARLSSLR